MAEGLVLSFKGMLMTVTQRTSKGGAKYTVYSFSSVKDGEFSLSGEGHVNLDDKYKRVDIDWTVGIVPSVFNGVTTLRVASLHGDLKGK